MDASNATLLGTTNDDIVVVYKPNAGQRPLWDFDSETLPVREVLTYEASRRMSLDVVPETVMADGPYGPGSVQRFVAADPDFDPLPMARSGASRLWPIALLDVVINNADRKLGHILEVDGVLVGIDHGLTFHSEDKLRTVLWCFSGEQYPTELRAATQRFAASLDEDPEPFASALSPVEMAALRARLTAIESEPHPEPPANRPPVPWPPY